MCDSLLWKFSKNHFKEQKYWLFHRNFDSFQKFNFFERISLLSILTFFWKNSNKMKKTSKKQILRHGVLLCVLVASKNDKLDISQTFWRVPPHKGLSSIRVMLHLRDFFYRFSLFSLSYSKTWSKWSARLSVERSRFFQNYGWFYEIITTCVP